MDAFHITYEIKLNDSVTEVFDFAMDGKTFDLVGEKTVENPPAWTELGFKQCSNCPLVKEDHPHCPMALQLHNIVKRFHTTRSIDVVELKVITESRAVTKVTALQDAISSMLGLLFPISGCPKTANMKPLSRFHVPMASEEEMVFHVSGMFLIAQYFMNNHGKKGIFSFDGLIAIYDDLHIVNKSVASRLQAVTSSDSVKNAITLLDMYSSLVPALLQDQLAELRVFFGAFLPEGEAEVQTKNNYLEQAKAFKLELIPIEGEEVVSEEAKELELQESAKADSRKLQLDLNSLDLELGPDLAEENLESAENASANSKDSDNKDSENMTAGVITQDTKISIANAPKKMDTAQFIREYEKKAAAKAIIDAENAEIAAAIAAIKAAKAAEEALRNPPPPPEPVVPKNASEQIEVVAEQLKNKFKSFLNSRKE